MKTRLFAFCVFTLCIVFGAMVVPALAQAPTPTTVPTPTPVATLDVVQIDAGLVAMTRDSGTDVRKFKMIPYAAPPVGDLRWKPPQPVASWQGVRRAENFSPTCMLNAPNKLSYTYLSDQAMSEDCLYLNVWTPAITNTAKLPVIVLIPPGANSSNSASNPQFEGGGFAKKGIIFVSFNFRLGVFGFLAHPDLTKESGSNNTSGNYGLLDQIAALKWVQKNIAAFGGDPNNVTIYGGPMFSLNVANLTASPLAKGLFQRGIGGSVSGWTSAVPAARGMKLADAEQAGVNWAKQNLNVSTITELRAKSQWDLIKVPVIPYTLIVDSYVIPDFVDNIYAKGQQSDVPLLIGWNKDEGTPTSVMASTVISYTPALQTRYGKFADQFLQVYPATTDAQAIEQSYAISRDTYASAQRAWARLHDKTGKTKMYMYYWTYAPPWRPEVKFAEISPATKMGASHFSDLDYIFGTLGLRSSQRQYTDVDPKLSDTISSYWVNFAKTGDPNGPGLPTWPVFDEKVDNPVLYIGAQTQPGTMPNAVGLDLFDTYYNSLRALQ